MNTLSKLLLSTLVAATPYSFAEQRPVPGKGNYKRAAHKDVTVKPKVLNVPNCNVPFAAIQSRILGSQKA